MGNWTGMHCCFDVTPELAKEEADEFSNQHTVFAKSNLKVELQPDGTKVYSIFLAFLKFSSELNAKSSYNSYD